jgi:hypothetical protein
MAVKPKGTKKSAKKKATKKAATKKSATKVKGPGYTQGVADGQADVRGSKPKRKVDKSKTAYAEGYRHGLLIARTHKRHHAKGNG